MASNNRKRLFIWEFLKVAEDSISLKCLKKKCHEEEIIQISNLINHLQRHSEEYKKYEEMMVAANEEEITYADDLSSTDCYLREPVFDYKMGKPFSWWTEHHNRYPTIALIATL